MANLVAEQEQVNVFLLLDSSASMTGAPLEALKQGVSLLHTTFATRSTRSVNIAAIRYESEAALLLPLRDPAQPFNLPDIDPGGTSSLGKALRLVEQYLRKKARTLVYIFTDGEEPTDEWDAAVQKIRPRVDKIYAVLCGLNPQQHHPDAYADAVFLMRDLTPDAVFSTFSTLT